MKNFFIKKKQIETFYFKNKLVFLKYELHKHLHNSAN